jgi:2-haloacid dehalogenase
MGDDEDMADEALRKAPSIAVFDLGKVLLEWDPRHLYRKVFAEEEQMEWFLATVTHHDWNLAQDKGRSWAEAEAEAIARHPDHAEEIRLYRARWNEMQPYAIAGTVAILEELHAANLPLYAITNWSGDTFRETVPRYAFFERFSGIIVSGDEGLLKPDPAIYNLLAERHGLDLTDCVFIDDSAKSVVGAEAVGMVGLHFTSPETLRADLVRLGLLGRS